jgi:RNA-directed DNA polymerase
MAEASNSDTVSTRQQRIAELARQSPQMGFTSLNHHIDRAWLLQAFLRTRRDGATGVDGQTASDFMQRLPENLQSLEDRAKTGTYRAPPVRRVHIPKGPNSSETRPIGIPTFEDKVLQRAVVMALEPIYEQDFLDCSYGFRPGRSAHQALQSLWQQTMAMGGGWIVEVDIRKFFDTLCRTHLRELLRHRVRDGVLLRLIDKWLNAGVLDGGAMSYPDAGCPQGGVLSPLLSNVYLHYVVDVWFEEVVKPCLRGRAFLVRYADDLVMGFACEEDAKRVLEVLPKRFAKYGLTIHPEKTQLVRFAPPTQKSGGDKGPKGPHPETFDFLGFTHFWGRSRKGTWIVKRQTSSSRFRRAIRTIAEWCRVHRHRPMGEQQTKLSQKLRGHYGYFGITGNSRALKYFADGVRRVWRKWLSRRSWASRLSWDRFDQLVERYALPPPVAIHSRYRRGSEAMT